MSPELCLTCMRPGPLPPSIAIRANDTFWDTLGSPMANDHQYPNPPTRPSQSLLLHPPLKSKRPSCRRFPSRPANTSSLIHTLRSRVRTSGPNCSPTGHVADGRNSKDLKSSQERLLTRPRRPTGLIPLVRVQFERDLIGFKNFLDELLGDNDR